MAQSRTTRFHAYGIFTNILELQVLCTYSKSPDLHASNFKICSKMVNWILVELKNDNFLVFGKVEKILKGSLDSISPPSPSVKIQIKGGKVCLRRKGKTLLGIVNKLLYSEGEGIES